LNTYSIHTFNTHIQHTHPHSLTLTHFCYSDCEDELPACYELLGAKAEPRLAQYGAHFAAAAKTAAKGKKTKKRGVRGAEGTAAAEAVAVHKLHVIVATEQLLDGIDHAVTPRGELVVPRDAGADEIAHAIDAAGTAALKVAGTELDTLAHCSCCFSISHLFFNTLAPLPPLSFARAT
jgi:hypothetical protein